MTKMMGGWIGKWGLCRLDANAILSKDTLPEFVAFSVHFPEIPAFWIIVCGLASFLIWGFVYSSCLIPSGHWRAIVPCLLICDNFRFGIVVGLNMFVCCVFIWVLVSTIFRAGPRPSQTLVGYYSWVPFRWHLSIVTRVSDLSSRINRLGHYIHTSDDPFRLALKCFVSHFQSGKVCVVARSFWDFVWDLRLRRG